MRERIRVVVTASDPISQSGIEAQLRGRPRCTVLEQMHVDRAQVAIVVVDEIDEAACRTIKAIQRNGVPRVVVVSNDVDNAGLMQAIEAGNYPEVSRCLDRAAGGLSRIRSRRRWWFNLPTSRNCHQQGANPVS